MEKAMSEQKICLFYPAYYETSFVYLHDYPQNSGDYVPPVVSTLEEAPPWVRKRVALINILEPYDETPFGEWQPGAFEPGYVTDNTPSIYRTYFIIVTTKTAQTWGKGWKKR